MSLLRYAPDRNVDLLIAQLWARMDADGDLDRVFSNPGLALGDFFTLMRSPREMLYAIDGEGIWFAVWFEPFMLGTFLSAYLRPDRRRTLAAGSLFMRCLRAGVNHYGTILNLTWQEELLPVHEAMGYTFVGRIPKLFNGRDALVLAASAETMKGRQRWHSSQDSSEAVRVAQPLAPVQQVPPVQAPQVQGLRVQDLALLVLARQAQHSHPG